MRIVSKNSIFTLTQIMNHEIGLSMSRIFSEKNIFALTQMMHHETGPSMSNS